MLTQAAENPSHSFSSFDLASRRSVIVAISGGSDSTALLIVLRDFLDRHAPDTKPIAVTVDHGLRASSSDEALAVAALCARLGIPHRTLSWTGAKPKTGIPAAAREARYRLLSEAAHQAGTDLVLTGHTADDQIETVAMRASRGDGRGLAGMAPATLHQGSVWICRPLLGAWRRDLRSTLTVRGIGWIDDPTNVDPAFERPRMRASLAADSGDRERDLAAIADAADAREAQGRAAAQLVEAHVSRAAHDALRIDPGLIAGASKPAAIHALRLLLATVGGCEQLPDLARATDLFERLGTADVRATLSRCLVEVRKTGISLRREARGKTAFAALPARVAPYAGFLPCFDLAPARALAALLGAPMPPPPPFRMETPFPGHIDGKA